MIKEKDFVIKKISALLNEFDIISLSAIHKSLKKLREEKQKCQKKN